MAKMLRADRKFKYLAENLRILPTTVNKDLMELYGIRQVVLDRKAAERVLRAVAPKFGIYPADATTERIQDALNILEARVEERYAEGRPYHRH